MAHLAALFDQLPGPHARRAALDAILCNLSSCEWRHLADELQHHSFAKDVVGSLSVELVALVFAHLPPNAPFLYQTVSRRWRNVLSSSHVISSSLSQWYSHADPRLQGEIQGAVQDMYATQLLKAEHAWRFQRNRPFSHRQYSYTGTAFSDGNGDNGDAFCVEDTICWLDNHENRRELRLCNLRTGETTSIRGEAREHLRRFTLSTKIVAFLASGRCYVYNLQNRERSYFRLQHTGSNRTMALAAQDYSLAVVYYSPEHPRLEAAVYLHNAQEQRTRHFLVKVPASPDTPQKLEVTAVLLNQERGLVNLFFMTSNAPGQDEFPAHHNLHCVSYTFRGEQVQSDKASRLYDGDSRVKFLGTPQAVDYTNRIHVFKGHGKRYQSTLLYFDNHVGRFTSQVVCRQGWLDFQTTLLTWKGVGYFGLRDVAKTEETCDCEICTGHELHQLHDEFHQELDFIGQRAKAFVLGNECFLVVFSDLAINVYCFDKHIQLPSDIQFRN